MGDVLLRMIYNKVYDEGYFEKYLTLYLLDIPTEAQLIKSGASLLQSDENCSLIIARGFDDNIKVNTTPFVATVFSIENATANSSRRGVLQITVPSDVKNLRLLGPNNRVKSELEVIFNVKPEEYSEIIKIEITVDDARRLVKDILDKELPQKIYGIDDATRIIDSAIKTDLVTSEKFLKEALKYNIKK